MWTDTHLTLHRRSRLFINITSMVDVLFILLIFFAVSATFDQTGTFEVDLPSAQGGDAPVVKTHVVTLFKRESLALDGARMDLKQLIEKVRSWPQAEKSKPVLLKADKQAPYGEVIHLLDELRKEGVLKVQALTKNE